MFPSCDVAMTSKAESCDFPSEGPAHSIFKSIVWSQSERDREREREREWREGGGREGGACQLVPHAENNIILNTYAHIGFDLSKLVATPKYGQMISSARA